MRMIYDKLNPIWIFRQNERNKDKQERRKVENKENKNQKGKKFYLMKSFGSIGYGL